MSWTYNLYGGPGAPLGAMTVLKDEEPGHILVIERRTEPGVCDGYFLRVQDHDTHTAIYDWTASGTAELVVPAVIRQATQRGQG